MVTVCGHRLGLLATLDLIGLDVSLGILNTLHERDARFNLPPADLHINLGNQDRLGTKTGPGFYNY